MKSLGKKTEWSRLSGLAHSTPLCYTPITLAVEAGKTKPTFERLPCTLGNQVTSRDAWGAWKVAVRQRPPVLLSFDVSAERCGRGTAQLASCGGSGGPRLCLSS